MKKSLSIFLVMILSLCLFFTGCENNNINNSSYGVNNTLNNIDNTNQEELNQIENNEQPETIKTQIETGTYVCEYKNYIFYRVGLQ